MSYAHMASQGRAGKRAVTHVVVAGLMAAVAGVATSQPVHAATTLLASTGPLAGSQTALILGGTTQPTPSPEFARSAENLFLNPLGFNGG